MTLREEHEGLKLQAQFDIQFFESKLKIEKERTQDLSQEIDSQKKTINTLKKYKKITEEELESLKEEKKSFEQKTKIELNSLNQQLS